MLVLPIKSWSCFGFASKRLQADSASYFACKSWENLVKVVCSSPPVSDLWLCLETRFGPSNTEFKNIWSCVSQQCSRSWLAGSGSHRAPTSTHESIKLPSSPPLVSLPWDGWGGGATVDVLHDLMIVFILLFILLPLSWLQYAVVTLTVICFSTVQMVSVGGICQPGPVG